MVSGLHYRNAYGGQKAMSLRKQTVIFGVVGALTGLGLTLTMLQNAAVVLASAVWGY